MERKELTQRILDLEWEMFTSVQNTGGRASCQDDKPTFIIMRRAQAAIWSIETLKSYLKDLEKASKKKINLMSIKYARMMERTFPQEFEVIKKTLPEVTRNAEELVSEIMKYHLQWSIEASKMYPKLFALGRPVTVEETEAGPFASMDNYLRSELLTYSESTLELCMKDTLKAVSVGVNLTLEIMKNTAGSYGYETLDEIEKELAKKV